MNRLTQPPIIVISILLALVVLSSGCSVLLPGTDPPALIPTEQIPETIPQTTEVTDTGDIPTSHPQATGEVALPTEIPTETPAQDPAATPVLAPTEPSPTNDGTETEELLPTTLPPGEIQIVKPGALSKVASPIKLHAYLVPGARGRVRIEVIGEDGDLLYRRILVYDMPPGQPINMFTDIDFELDGLAETARLVISTDDTYGRFNALASVDIILLSVGTSDLNTEGDLRERIIINQPEEKHDYDGGNLMVTGLVRTESEKPLLVELIAADGRVVGTRQAGIAPGDPGIHREFSSEVPYQVTGSTWVRLTIYETGDRIPGPVHIKTMLILLNP